MTEIDLGKITITSNGAWDEKTAYTRLVTVTRLGQSYLSIQPNIGIKPEEDTEMVYWLLIAARGESLYQMMVRTGKYTGTEEEFLNDYVQKLADAVNATNAANTAADNANTAKSNAETATQNANDAIEAIGKTEQHISEAETLRVKAEKDRVKKDQTMNENEAERNRQLAAAFESMNTLNKLLNKDEQTRKDNETTRQSNEEDRQSSFNTLKQQSENATSEANTAAENANTKIHELDTYQQQVDDIKEKDTTQDTDIRNLKEKDTNLQEQIDALVSRSDIVDIVSNKAGLDAYDITTITANDVIKVLKDENHKNETTYYRLIDNVWTFLGSIGAHYTKSESDTIFATKDELNTEKEKNTEQDTKLAVLELEIGNIGTYLDDINGEVIV